MVKKLSILSPIGYYDNEPDYFNYLLDQQAQDFKLVVSSGGGDLMRGLSIAGLIKEKSKEVNITSLAVGLVASAATLPFLAANRVTMDRDSVLMIHQVAGSYIGIRADEMREEAEVIDEMNEIILNVYTEKAAGNKKDKSKEVIKAEFKKMLEKDTYITASKALELGLIDEIVNAAQDDKEQATQAQQKANNISDKALLNNIQQTYTNYYNFMDKNTKTAEQLEAEAKNGFWNWLKSGFTSEKKEEQTSAPVEPKEQNSALQNEVTALRAELESLRTLKAEQEKAALEASKKAEQTQAQEQEKAALQNTVNDLKKELNALKDSILTADASARAGSQKQEEKQETFSGKLGKYINSKEEFLSASALSALDNYAKAYLDK